MVWLGTLKRVNRVTEGTLRLEVIFRARFEVAFETIRRAGKRVIEMDSRPHNRAVTVGAAALEMIRRLDGFMTALTIGGYVRVIVAAVAGFTGLKRMLTDKQKRAVHLRRFGIGEQANEPQARFCLRWERQPDQIQAGQVASIGSHGTHQHLEGGNFILESIAQVWEGFGQHQQAVRGNLQPRPEGG